MNWKRREGREGELEGERRSGKKDWNNGLGREEGVTGKGRMMNGEGKDLD